MIPRRSPRLLAYVIAILLVLVAIALTLLFRHLFGQPAFTFFYLAVYLSTWKGGKYPSITTIILSLLAINYFFVPPLNSWALSSKDVVRLGIYAAVMLLISGLTIALVDARHRLEQSKRQIEQREAQYRSIVEDQTELIVRFLPDSTISFVNEAYCRYFGVQREELIGRSYAPTILADDCDRVHQQVRLLSIDNPIVTITNRVVINGEIRWTEWVNRLVTNSSGQTVEIQAVGRDITHLKHIEESLRLSEERLTLALEGSGDGLWDWNIPTGEIYLNSNWLKMLGYEKTDLRPHVDTWKQLIHPDDYAPVIERLNAHLQNNSIPYAFDYRLRTKSGEWKWIASYGRVALHAEDGTPLRMVGMHQDISDRKQAEEQLRILSDRLTLALKSGAIGTWDWDLIHDAYFDERMCELYGLQNRGQNVPYHDWRNLLHPDDRQKISAATQAALRGDQEFDTEFRIIRPDGALRYIKAFALVQRDAQGIPQRMVGINYDISERKQVEAALVHYTHEIEDLYNNAPCGYHSLDPEGRYIRVNETELKLLGYSQEEMVGQPIVHFLTDASRQDFFHNYSVLQAQGWVKNLEYDMVCKDGTILPVMISAIAVKDSDGTFLYNRATLVDIRDRKQAEEQLRLSAERISLANAELSRAARLKDEFLAGMSHELRTPLNAVLGMSEVLREEIYGPLTSQQCEAVTLIERSGNHLLTLINDILDLAKVESGKMDLEIHSVSPQQLCDTSLSFIKQQAYQKRIQVICTLDEAITDVEVDERRIRQVLINLLSNAVKFTPEGGQVQLSVHAHPTQETVEFAITDTGIGIAANQMNKLFQPFVQLDSSLSRRHSGTGLGLALVRRIIELHGGSITVDSTVGQGSCFTIFLPQRQTGPAPVMPQPSWINGSDLSIERALIVEDSETAANQVSRYLTELGIATTVHPLGHGVVDLALRTQPDVIILDLLLPDLSGWDVLTHLKAHPITCTIPVLIVSVVDDQARGVELGATDYLLKPITRRQLQQALNRLRHQAESEPPPGGSPATSADHTPLIVLAEDNEANIETTLNYLQAYGLRTAIARNGLEAVQLVKQHRPDLVLMDIQMPQMDGLEAIQQIRADATLATLPIIALTALAMPGDRERCLTAGANEYMTKPVSFKQLLQLIQQFIPDTGHSSQR